MKGFTPIKGFEKYYLINEKGDIYSLRKQKILSPSIKKKDLYPRVTLFVNNKPYYKTIHRLLAETFIPNPNNYPLVLHKIAMSDGGKSEVSNLYWGTQSNNMKDRTRDGHFYNPNLGKFGENNRFAKKVYQYDKNKNFIKVWNCIRTAAKELNIKEQHISKVCHGRGKTTGGYIFSLTPLDNA